MKVQYRTSVMANHKSETWFYNHITYSSLSWIQLQKYTKQTLKLGTQLSVIAIIPHFLTGENLVT